MKKKYLPLYYKWMKTKMLPKNGLCNSLIADHTLKLFEPWDTCWYWGYRGVPHEFSSIPCYKQNRIKYQFTTMRQNIVLFLAAMNGEL